MRRQRCGRLASLALDCVGATSDRLISISDGADSLGPPESKGVDGTRPHATRGQIPSLPLQQMPLAFPPHGLWFTSPTESSISGDFAMAGPNTLTINDANFQSEVLQSAVPVLIDFWAPWCQPCLKLAPTIDELANDFVGRAKVAKLDIDSAMELAGQFNINSIPTVIIMKGGQPVARIGGVSAKAVYADALEKALKA